MNNQEQHWHHLFGSYTPEGTAWHAKVTVYAPDLQILRAYQFTRTFSTNEEGTIVTHHNQYFLPDGTTKEQTWQIPKETCNQPDGVIHPEAPTMRTLSLGQGATAWVPKQVTPEKAFSAELFLRRENHRFSVVLVYTLEGGLDRLVPISEQVDQFPPQEKGTKFEELLGRWQETVDILTPDLKVETQADRPFWQDLKLESSFHQGNKTYFLEDGFVVNLPQSLPKGQSFSLTVGKQIASNEYRQLTLAYDPFGHFQEIRCQTFRKT